MASTMEFIREPRTSARALFPKRRQGFCVTLVASGPICTGSTAGNFQNDESPKVAAHHGWVCFSLASTTAWVAGDHHLFREAEPWMLIIELGNPSRTLMLSDAPTGCESVSIYNPRRYKRSKTRKRMRWQA